MKNEINDEKTADIANLHAMQIHKEIALLTNDPAGRVEALLNVVIKLVCGSCGAAQRTYGTEASTIDDFIMIFMDAMKCGMEQLKVADKEHPQSPSDNERIQDLLRMLKDAVNKKH